MSSLYTSSNTLPQPGSYPGSRPRAVGSWELGWERRSKQQGGPGRFLLRGTWVPCSCLTPTLSLFLSIPVLSARCFSDCTCPRL